MKHLTTKRMLALALGSCLALALVGCGNQTAPSDQADQTDQTGDDTPTLETSAAVSASPETTANGDITQAATTDASAAAALSLVGAEFGAPVTGDGYFPLDEQGGAALSTLLPADESALAAYQFAEAPGDSVVKLYRSDGSTLCLDKTAAQFILVVGNSYYDCTGSIDFEAICRTLEAAQLRAVLADLPDIDSIQYIDPEDSSRDKSMDLTNVQSAELWGLMQTDQWTIPDMYTAQDLSRGWPEMIELYDGGQMVAQITHGDIQGTVYTVIFYRIGGAEGQTAYVFAPKGVYDIVSGYFA